MSKAMQRSYMKAISKIISPRFKSFLGNTKDRPVPVRGRALFVKLSKAFLEKLGDDLGFCEQQIHTSYGNENTSACVSLRGFWDTGSGVSIWLEQYAPVDWPFSFYPINNDGKLIGSMQWLKREELEKADYAQLLSRLSQLKTAVESEEECYDKAA